MPVVAALEKEVVSLDVLRVAGSQSSVRICLELEGKSVGDPRADRVLDVQHVGRIVVERLRPQRLSIDHAQ